MKRILPAILLIFLASSPLFGQLVDNALGRSLGTIFPELKDGYIDLNRNGRGDSDDETSEFIIETRVNDGRIQVQEVLDFLELNYPYIAYDKIVEVRNSLDDASGEISEIIALTYRLAMDEILRKREALGRDTIILTPSARAEAEQRISDLLGKMNEAFQREGRQDETAFVQARDELYSLFKIGYPVPEGISVTDRRMLEATLLNTIIKKEADVPIAIKMLGRLRSEASLTYIIDLSESPEYRNTAIEALGFIGSNTALSPLKTILERAYDDTSSSLAIEAIGRIGSKDSIDSLLDLANSTDRNPQIKASVLSAFRALGDRNIVDIRIQNTLKEFTENSNPELRALAVAGLEYYPNNITLQLLLPKLETENDQVVLAALIKTLNNLRNPAALSTFSRLLQKDTTSTSTKVILIEAIGKNPDGVKVIAPMLEYIGDPNEELRTIAHQAMINLYEVAGSNVVGIIGRPLLTNPEKDFAVEASAILAEIADPNSINTFTALLTSPYAEVKRNATWGLYRLESAGNVRIVQLLQKVAASETESLNARINAVRILGKYRIDSPQLQVWKTLNTIISLRGDKYTYLRKFAIDALGEMNTVNEEIVLMLLSSLRRESNILIRQSLVQTIGKLNLEDDQSGSTFLTAFEKVDDIDTALLYIQVMGDLGLSETVQASRLFLEKFEGYPEVLSHALLKIPSEDSFNLILDLAENEDAHETIEAILQDADPFILKSVLDRRRQTEENQTILTFLEGIESP
jgi:HEAT repeat protein